MRNKYYSLSMFRNSIGGPMGMSGVSKSQVSRLCEEIDERVNAFLQRPIEGEWPYVWIDATYVKVRQDHRITSVAVIIAVGVNAEKLIPERVQPGQNLTHAVL